MSLDWSLDDNGKQKVQEEELADDDNHKDVEGANERDVNIHQVHDLVVPGFARDHLENCQKRAP